MYLQVVDEFIIYRGACYGNGFDEFVSGANALNFMEESRRTVRRLVMHLVGLRYPNGILKDIVFAFDCEYKRVFVLPVAQGKVETGCIHGPVEQSWTVLAGCNGKRVYDLHCRFVFVERAIAPHVIVERAIVRLASHEQQDN